MTTENTELAVPMTDMDLIAGMSDTTSQFLPRLQLFGATSKPVMEGKVRGGEWGYFATSDTIVPLGNEIRLQVLAARPKAMCLFPEILVSFDPKDELFQRIHKAAQGGVDKHMSGPEYALYLVDQGVLVSFFVASTSAKREVGPLNADLGAAVEAVKAQREYVRKVFQGTRTLITGKSAKTAGKSWFAPKFAEDVNAIGTFDEPDYAAMLPRITTFLNPPKQEIELARQEAARER